MMSQDIAVESAQGVATIEIRRPPLNYFDLALVESLGQAIEAIDADHSVRAVVLAAQGKAFCAGANFTAPASAATGGKSADTGELYWAALRIFRGTKPIVAAVHGAAIGGGLGLAMAADFRVTCPEARFAANFTRIGFHPGFGLTTTLPEAIGRTNAELMFYTSRRVTGTEAHSMGLANSLVAQDDVRSCAVALAREIAECSPLGLLATRATMRRGLAERVEAAMVRELAEQNQLRNTDDFQEGVRSTAERRPANFSGR